MSLMNIQKFFKEGYFLYILLIVIIITPYLIHKGELLVGGDLGFFEDSIRINTERLRYIWSDHLGVGGLSVGKYGNFLYYNIINALSIFLNDVTIQLVTKIVFYTLGYLGIYLSLREYSFYKNELVYPLALNSVAFFFCTNLILFDLTRTWLHLFYIFCFLVPMFIYNGLKYLRTGSFKFLVFFLILSYINTPIFTNISYPPIQFLTIFSILFILEGRQIKLKRLSALFFFYFVVNIPSLIENIILIMQLKDLFVNSDFNKTLIEDYSTTQKNFFSLVNIIQNISGRLFSENWSYQGKIPQFYFSELYTSLFKIINIVPLLLIFLSFIKNTYQRQNKKMLYLLMVYLIAIPLTTMQGFPPLSSLFSYLFTHFTEIGVFRNSLKFSVLLMTVLCFIIYFIINKKKGYTVFFCVTFYY